jgi:SAM-dependent methyltransferase
MPDSDLNPGRIFQIATGAWAAGVQAAAATHSIFTHLEAGHDTVEAVAGKAGISARGAATLLDGLVAIGLATVSNGRYRNAPDASEFLVEGKPGYFGGFPRAIFAAYADWLSLPEVVRRGEPLASNTADVEENPFWVELVPAIMVLAIPVALQAAEKLGIARAGDISILDVGGGSGAYSAVWLSLNSRARATQIDWANVNRIARKIVGARGVGDRFRTIDADFHGADFGSAEHDIAVYSHIAHQEGPDANRATFRKFRKALKPGGTLLVADFVVDDGRTGPPFPLLFRSEMLMRTREGSTWTRTDYRSWLGEAGFGKVEFVETSGPASLIFAS